MQTRDGHWYGVLVNAERVGTATYRTILSSVERGEYPAGARLPGERTLAAQLGVSRSTLRTALLRLAAEGVLQNSAQRGWFVPAHLVGEPPSTLQSFTEMALARGLRPTSSILSLRQRPADLDESQRLRVAPAAPVLQLVRLRGMDHTDICVDTAVLPMALAGPLLSLDLTDRSLYEVLHQECGVRIHRSSYSVQAQAAPGDVADLLGVPAGWPLLVGRETAYAADGRPVNVGLAQYRGDAYQFQADLFRSAD